MRLVLLIGNAPNQIALENKLHSDFEITGVVLENSKPSRPKRSLLWIIEKVLDFTIFYSIKKSWTSLMQFYFTKYPNLQSKSVLKVINLNSSEVIEFIKLSSPDYLVVSGTRLIKEEIINLGVPILNLHTGLSPYVNGGPNCTNWCLSLGTYHKIGNTIMWLDSGIDSGNIINTSPVEFTGSESLQAIHKKVMESAHELYLSTLKLLSSGVMTYGIRQKDIGVESKTYYNRQWGITQKFSLVRNIYTGHFKNIVNSPRYSQDIANLKLVHSGQRKI